jgi:CRP-like cAMP-binding protein
MSDVQSFLFETNLFSDLTGNQLYEIAELASVERIEGPSYLFHEGDEADALYLIRDGLIEVRIEGGAGDEPTTINTLGPHEVLGELSLYGNQTRSASAYVPASEETTLIRLAREPLKELLGQNSDIEVKILRRILSNVSERLRQLDRKHEVVYSALKDQQ